MKNLQDLRKEVDSIDKKINELFIRRLDIVKKIKKEKIQLNLETIDRKREKEIFENLENYTKVEYHQYSHDLFENIIRISKDFQEKYDD
ncbi:chorismate mutase [Lagierella sp.]|uniref:chorismate mutase n=1 Tax=Lagierella sp. TaxID=2849657 RepID=UPI002604A97E|nr:chorismate mutase [Lagierella sp.]